MIDQDLKDLMDTQSGRRFIYRLLQDCEVDSADMHRNEYQLGKRSVGMELLQEIRSLPDGLNLEMQMRMEARAQPQKKTQKSFYDQFTGVNEND